MRENGRRLECHVQRTLRDARGLNDAVVESILRREARERSEQILAQGAADATVRELDHLLLALLQRAATATHQLRVHVDRRHVVDDHGDARACAIVQQVVEQRRCDTRDRTRHLASKHPERAFAMA